MNLKQQLEEAQKSLRDARELLQPRAPHPEHCNHPERCILTGRCERRVRGELWTCID
jgi:hypothetical protein